MWVYFLSHGFVSKPAHGFSLMVFDFRWVLYTWSLKGNLFCSLTVIVVDPRNNFFGPITLYLSYSARVDKMWAVCFEQSSDGLWVVTGFNL